MCGTYVHMYDATNNYMFKPYLCHGCQHHEVHSYECSSMICKLNFA
jgi:hypothetical protein